MSTELFQCGHSLSPRLAWLGEHDLIVREYQHPHSLNGNARFVCSNRAMTRWACGATEDEACLSFANREGILHYKAEEYARATESEIGATAFTVPVRGVYVVTKQTMIDGIEGMRHTVVEADSHQEAHGKTAAQWEF